MGGVYKRLKSVDYNASTPDELDSGSITVGKNTRVVVNIIADGSVELAMRFNDDNQQNYSMRYDVDDTGTGYQNRTAIDSNHSGASNIVAIYNIHKATGKEPLVLFELVDGGGSDASSSPHMVQGYGKWTNTGAITSIQIINVGGGSFASGSEMIIYEIEEQTTSDEKTTLTNVPTGTRYEETDTRKIYRRKAGATGVDVPTNAGWSADTTDISTSSSGVAFSFDSSSINETVYYDLQNANVLNGSNLNNSKWTLRGKLVFTTNTANGTAANAFDVRVVLHASTSFSGETPNGDGIWWLWGNRSSNGIYQYLYSRDGSSSAIQTSVTDAGSVGANTWYFEISRTGDTTVTFKLFTDSAFSTQSGSTVSITGASSDVDDLRYLHVSGFSQTVSSPGNMTGTISELKIYDDAIPSEIDPSWVERNTA